jgi:hypothetical protein
MNQLHLVILRMMTVSLITILSLASYSQSNYAVSLDGINDYVSLSTGAAVSQSNTFTIEGWVYWNGTGNGCIYSETVQGNDNPMLSISPRAVDGGGIELVFRDNSLTGLVLQPAAATITANTWVHVAIVRTSATNIKTYINGVLKDDVTFTAPAAWTPTQVNAGIRWRASQDGPFAGKIDELRIWNTARTPAEIKANMFNKNLSNSAIGLVAYYKMNDGSGTTASNSCTNTPGIDGTLTNGPTWSASPIQFGGNALHFDQADDRVIAPLATTATSNVTMELLVNHEGGTGTDHLLVSNGVMGTNGYALYINTQRKLCVQYNAVGTWNTNYVIPSNTWTHIALVIDAAGFTVYANGANVYSNTATPVAPTGNFILGYNTVANGQPFDGMMDEVRVWNTARTQTEIQNTMNTEIDPTALGLALYYTFNQGIGGGTNTGLATVIDQSGTNNGTLANFALSGATSNFLSQNSGLSVLPLKWLSFSAQMQGETVLLQWSTSSEVSVGDFTVEHQTTAGDWQSIGLVRSEGGNDKAVHSYSFKHSSPSAGMNYYRIKQTDIDGRYSYSMVRSVEMDNARQSFRVIANPISNKTLQIKVDDEKGQMILLFTYDGKLVWKKKFPVGVHSIQTNQLPEGVYVVGNSQHSEKILVH